MEVPALIASQKRHRRRLGLRHDAHAIAATFRARTRFCNLVRHRVRIAYKINSAPISCARGRIRARAHIRAAVFVDPRTNLKERRAARSNLLRVDP